MSNDKLQNNKHRAGARARARARLDTEQKATNNKHRARRKPDQQSAVAAKMQSC